MMCYIRVAGIGGIGGDLVHICRVYRTCLTALVLRPLQDHC